MLVFKGREAANALGIGRGAFSAEVLQRSVHVNQIPKDEDVQDEPEGAELVFLANTLAGVVKNGRRLLL